MRLCRKANENRDIEWRRRPLRIIAIENDSISFATLKTQVE